VEEEKSLDEEIKEEADAGDGDERNEECGDASGCTGADESETQEDTQTADEQDESNGESEEADAQAAKPDDKNGKEALIQELKDKFTRQMAEFDNFRKRTEKEKSAMYEVGARSVIEKILPIVDNFERGLGSISEEEKQTPFADGMDKVYKQLAKALDDMDVKPIEALGKEFDPEYHNAVMHVDDEKVGENIIVEEFQKGYTYRDTVVRHSMVKVAN